MLRTRRNQIPIISQAQDDAPWGIGQRVIPNAPDRGGGQQDEWGIGRRIISNGGSNGRRPHVPQAPAAAHWSAHRTTPEPRGHNRRRRSLQSAVDGPEHFGAGLADLLGTSVSATEQEEAARKQAAYIADLGECTLELLKSDVSHRCSS